MNRTLKIWSIWTIGCIVLLFSARTALSESWWESKQEKNPADHIESTPSADVAGKTASASRTNWVDGYIEVLAGATADMRDTVNLAHAFSVATKTARHLAYEKLAETVAGINLTATPPTTAS